MSWLLNTLHEDLESSKHNSSIIYQSFQGELEVVKEIQRKGVSEKIENSDDLNMGTAVDGGAENDSIIGEASRMPFLMLGLDLPPFFSRM
ncbi:hypothetical protein Nepgr_029390 [Nepenthes gracilis]|uniref:Uncharacterized protein n=1 Tax=Nepenthes gracilis TaxID=150966 RepID=A0AAD3TDW3_NEPGR|nr:hypothetical protein Nepgr_029390 [Nepenthes gracilis]